MPDAAAQSESHEPDAQLAGWVVEDVGFPVLYLRWLKLRGPVAAVIGAAGMVLGFWMNWPAAFLVALLGLILIADVALRRRGILQSVTGSIVVDTTLVGIALLVLRAPPAVVAMPFAYLIATTFLFLPIRRALFPVAYSLAWMVFLLVGGVILWEPASGARAIAVSAVVGVVFVSCLVLMFGFVSEALGRIRASLDRKIRFEEAIAAASRAFAAADDESALAEALQALLRGTEAEAVFVERNVVDAERGLCSTLIAEVLIDGSVADPPDKWTMVPWSKMPFSYERLSQGRVAAFLVEDLPPVERQMYEGSEVVSEVDIPIMVRGSWAGLIGFNDMSLERPWSDRDIELLNTAAELIAAHWERLDARERLEDAVASLERRHDLEHGLARLSAALVGSGSSAVDDALGAMLSATKVDLVYIDVNYEDDELGLCTRIAHWALGEDARPTSTEPWWGGPYSQLPTAYERLSKGEPAMILTSQLEGEERRIYESDGILSELSLPIFSAGSWTGSIAFCDYHQRRQWTDEDIRFLRTAAEMVSAYWDRQHTLGALSERVALEEAVAGVSAELLTESERALPAALEHLLSVTGADYLWIEENFTDPEAGPSARKLVDVGAPGFDIDQLGGGFVDGPWSATPTAHGLLAAGSPSFITLADLEGDERALYEIDGLLSELMLPVYVYGEWFGSVGFADYSRERIWQEQDVRLMRTVAELIGSYLERKASRQRLEELIASKDQFVASISHEVRTPLTSVLGFANVLHDGYQNMSDADRLEMLELITREAQEVAWIIDDLLVFARSDIGTLAVSAVETPLDEQIRAVLAGQNAELNERVVFDRAETAAIADPGRVRQVLRNLITNAFKYGGPTIRVEVSVAGTAAVVSVVDDGDGIEEELRERVFDAYFRAHDPGGQPGSMGLGLNVSLKLARLMGGDLTYTHDGRHSTFSLLLPLAERPAPVSA